MKLPLLLSQIPFEQIPFDIIAENHQGDPVLLIEVKAENITDMKKARDWLIAHSQSYQEKIKQIIPFSMLVDYENIEIFALNHNQAFTPILTLKTATVLSYYDPNYEQKTIYYHYLVRLIETWLRDLAYHWKSDIPPAFEKIAEIGLLKHLDDGTTKSGEGVNNETIY